MLGPSEGARAQSRSVNAEARPATCVKARLTMCIAVARPASAVSDLHLLR